MTKQINCVYQPKSDIYNMYPKFGTYMLDCMSVIDGELCIELLTQDEESIVITAPIAPEIKIDEQGVKQTINVTEKKHYEDAGLSLPGYITFQEGNIVLTDTLMKDWIKPIDQIKYYDEICELLVRYNSYVEIMNFIDNELKYARSTPSDKQERQDPFLQYIDAINGDEKVQCSNIVNIFVEFLRVKGYIARRVNLWQGGLGRFGNYNYQTSTGHTVCEIYDMSLNEWFVTDPSALVQSFYIKQKIKDNYIAHINLNAYEVQVFPKDFINVYPKKEKEYNFNCWKPEQKISYVGFKPEE